jgi:hypothetical protein
MGKTIAIGAYGDNMYDGAVYVYQGGSSTGLWSNTQILYSDVSNNTQFGTNVQIYDAYYIAVTSPNDRDYNSYLYGNISAVYIFTESDNTWSQTHKLYNDDYKTGSPCSMIVSDEVLAVKWTCSDSGVSIYSFDDYSGDVTFVTEISSNDVYASSYFGNKMVFGSPGTIYIANCEDNQGYVSVYSYNEYGTYTWDYISRLKLNSGYVNNFGISLAVYGGNILIEYVSTSHYNGYYGIDDDDYNDDNSIAIREYKFYGSGSTDDVGNSDFSVAVFISVILSIFAFSILVMIFRNRTTNNTSSSSNAADSDAKAKILSPNPPPAPIQGVNGGDAAIGQRNMTTTGINRNDPPAYYMAQSTTTVGGNANPSSQQASVGVPRNAPTNNNTGQPININPLKSAPAHVASPPPPCASNAHIPPRIANTSGEVPANNANIPSINPQMPVRSTPSGFVASDTAPAIPISQEVPDMAIIITMSNFPDSGEDGPSQNEAFYYYGHDGPPPGSTVQQLAPNGEYVTILIPLDAVRDSNILYYY